MAVLACLAAPFWQPAILAPLHVHTPEGRALAEATLTLAQLTNRVEALRASLRAAEAAARAAEASAAAAAQTGQAARERLSTLALIQLSAAMRHPGRFETELAMVWAADGDAASVAPLLERIGPYAGFGIPAAAEVRESFAKLAARAVAEGDNSRLRWFSHLIGFAPGAASQADTAPALLQRAGQALESDDLAGALAIVQQLQGSPRELMADWTEDANARLAADTLAQRAAERATQVSHGLAGRFP